MTDCKHDNFLVTLTQIGGKGRGNALCGDCNERFNYPPTADELLKEVLLKERTLARQRERMLLMIETHMENGWAMDQYGYATKGCSFCDTPYGHTLDCEAVKLQKEINDE